MLSSPVRVTTNTDDSTLDFNHGFKFSSEQLEHSDSEYRVDNINKKDIVEKKIWYVYPKQPMIFVPLLFWIRWLLPVTARLSSCHHCFGRFTRFQCDKLHGRRRVQLNLISSSAAELAHSFTRLARRYASGLNGKFQLTFDTASLCKHW